MTMIEATTQSAQNAASAIRALSMAEIDNVAGARKFHY